MARPAPAVLVLAVALLLSGCGSVPIVSPGPSDPAEAFDNPPAWPGYQWSLNGGKVGWQVISTSAGPKHCGWDKATFLTLGWQPGTYSETSQHARQYIRDPKQVVDQGSFQSTLVMDAKLPPGARPTGLTYAHLAIYAGPDADQGIYVVGANRAERWPRSDPMTACA